MMEKLIVSSSPHMTGNASTRHIMLDVIVALTPACVAAVLIFGPICLAVIALGVIGAVAAEYICRKAMKRTQTIGDLSAAVTGLLVALNLPAIPASLWMAPLGSAIAIVVVKQCFGGLGQNFVNPAMAGRVVLMMSFTSQMSGSSWPIPFAWLGNSADAVTSATPLAEGGSRIGLTELFFGLHGGSMGETCAVALLLGGAYLCICKVIKPIIPLTFCGTTVLCCWAFTGGEQDMLTCLLSGGLLLGSIFMATDYVTTPVTNWGKVIFGVGCGLITALIRVFGILPEGVSFAIIIMNILTPLIDRVFIRRPFGAKKAVKEGK